VRERFSQHAQSCISADKRFLRYILPDTGSTIDELLSLYSCRPGRSTQGAKSSSRLLNLD
jgi:hypothetical protein